MLSGYLGMFADLAPGSVLVETGPGMQHNLSYAPPGLAEAATKCGSLVATNRLLRASYTQLLTLACATVHPKKPRNNTPIGKLQTTSEQNPKSFRSSISKGRSRQVSNPAEAISAS